jgi:hypothetical protein
MKKLLIISSAILITHVALREMRKRPPTVYYRKHIPGNFNGIALAPVGIFIMEKHRSNKALIDHEKIHWQQYQRMGLIPYYFNYLRDLMRYGYDKHPMEIEARQNEKSTWVQTNYTEAVRKGYSMTAFNPNFRS